MKLRDLLEYDVAPPVLYTVLMALLRKGEDVRLSVQDNYGQWVDGYIDDIDWKPNFPDIIGIDYSIQKRDGDYQSDLETEIEDVDSWTVTEHKGKNWSHGYWWLHKDNDEAA